MRTISLASFLAFAYLGLAFANPLDQQHSFEAPGTVHTTDSWDWKNCGTPEDAVQINSIQVFPDPPKPGEDLTVTVKGTAVETLEDGAYADVTVKLGLIKILQKTFDICEEARNANASVQCPVEKGEHVVTQTVALPKEIPKAKFAVLVRGYTVDDADMLCLELNVNFMKNPFPRIW